MPPAIVARMAGGLHFSIAPLQVRRCPRGPPVDSHASGVWPWSGRSETRERISGWRMLALTRAANPRPPFRRYAVAVLAAIMVVGVHLVLHRRFGPSFDPLFLVVVGLSAWYGGFGPGLVTLAASGLGALLTTIPPVGSLRVTGRLDVPELMAYGVSGLVLNGLIASILATRRRAEAAREQVAFLAEVSEVLASSLDYRATLSAAARLAVPRLADWCAVDVVDADGRLHRLAITHVDPAKVEAVWAMSHRYRELAEDPVPQVIRSGRPQIIPAIPDELLRRFARDEQHLQGLRSFGLRSLLIVPLTARGRTLGAITLVTAESGRHYSEADLLPAELLARRAATAVDNARLFQEAEEALREKERTLALLDTVFRGAPIGLAFVDRGLRFVRVNEALAAMNEAPVEAHLGRTVAEVPGPLVPSVAPMFESVFRTGQPLLDLEILSAAPAAAQRTYLASYYPVATAEGRTEWV